MEEQNGFYFVNANGNVLEMKKVMYFGSAKENVLGTCFKNAKGTYFKNAKGKYFGSANGIVFLKWKRECILEKQQRTQV